jgi:hypothetical protein
MKDVQNNILSAIQRFDAMYNIKKKEPTYKKVKKDKPKKPKKEKPSEPKTDMRQPCLRVAVEKRE